MRRNKMVKNVDADHSPKKKDWEAIDRFRAMGYAVVLFSPEEFQGLSKEDLENHIVNCASDFIEDSLDYDEDYDD